VGKSELTTKTGWSKANYATWRYQSQEKNRTNSLCLFINMSNNLKSLTFELLSTSLF